MRVRVLDGGVIGVTSARYLAKAGHEPTVVGRQAGPMARGSGRLLADLVSGRATDIDVCDRGIGRYFG